MYRQTSKEQEKIIDYVILFSNRIICARLYSDKTKKKKRQTKNENTRLKFFCMTNNSTIIFIN